MRTLTALIMILALGMAGPRVAAVTTYQLVWEMFDGSRLKTTCTYRAKTGEYRSVEYEGAEFCPRVI